MDLLLAVAETNSSFNNALVVTSVAILVTMILALIRAMLGPTVFDRVLALNMFGTKTVLLICVIGFLTGRTDFLDLALLYSLMNFIGMVALLRFSEYGSFREEGADIGSSAKS
ncbi:monovalent cation/H+ antiporter complex subunit F [Mariniblastus sp.]|jgi:multicomponent Na+:H+ antiporter subunit F|nr:monovalent cation/H+ antiporter complex subunit F [bacterium]MDA7924123.1 monovalent cation/H+ antiporter complex subunit F [Mariniblastus sp.]MDA7884975.1 monovalent cation/H+ antiporter complex subunit F [bacterium]MDA7901787.1 monovalent cation/H+ antiporter complex subunit F [bacterium]MDA7928590.1 monovalent cation/H+ antiporter complex subunit F [Mariniblastus sp.]